MNHPPQQQTIVDSLVSAYNRIQFRTEGEGNEDRAGRRGGEGGERGGAKKGYEGKVERREIARSDTKRDREGRKERNAKELSGERRQELASAPVEISDFAKPVDWRREEYN